jgi:hypothetical protein
MTDGQPVGFGDFEEMVGRQQAPGARHIVDDDGRISWNMFAEMAGDKTSIRIVPASRRCPNDNSNCFSFVERRCAVGRLPSRSDENQQS